MIYTIRPNTAFTIEKDGVLYGAGQDVDLTESEFEIHKHKLEGVESTVEPIDSANNNGYPAPYFTKATPAKILIGQSQVIALEGSFFTPNTTVELEQGTVDAIEFISDNQIKITVTAANTVGNYDLIINNGNQTIVEDAIAFFDVPDGLVDLRLGGTAFSNSAIEMRSGMNFERQSGGLIFTGSSPWNSWARFVGDSDEWMWNRTQKKKLTWIYKHPVSNMMLGIGSRSNNPTSSRQYEQSELLIYEPNGDRISYLFGNNGNLGSRVLQNFSVLKAGKDTIKAVISKNGENGGVVEIYRLPNTDIASWFDTSEKLGEITIAGMGSDEPEIMPFAIPAAGNNQFLLGFILEDE